MLLWKKLWLFLLFSGDKGDYSDVWMIKIKVKTNEIDMDVCFFQKWVTYKNHVCPKVWLFLLVNYFVIIHLTDKHGTKYL